MPTEKIAQAKTAASKTSWGLRYWVAGAAAIILLLVLFLFVQIYSERSASDLREANRFKAFAAQYMHVLRDPTLKTVPAPVLDNTLGEPIMIADRERKSPLSGDQPGEQGKVTIRGPQDRQGLGCNQNRTDAVSEPRESGGSLHRVIPFRSAAISRDS